MPQQYEYVFKSVLNEYSVPDISRNRDDVQIAPEVGDEAFNVDPANVNVGFKSNNTEHDVKKLKAILNEISNMSDKLKEISESVASLDRSFSGIGKSSKTVANINQKLLDLVGELEGYVISLPAQKDDAEKVQNNPVQ